ncbi:hypothetical protein HAX54_025770 [Datura stramonium]|uniref:RNase H type-1 domain-containing protein n=1 Tax=Datura stramonium TaxID=4076 RepID=A0ABS8S766_DATST|nr:hypothetical protein [Datura stramonium]
MTIEAKDTGVLGKIYVTQCLNKELALELLKIKGNPSPTGGGGGFIRDDRGELIKDFTYFYGICSNNNVEAKVMRRGVLICNTIGLSNVLVESDAHMIVNMINKRNKSH